jgi:glycosyltransferase involved in cell wall biosynthesis
MISVIIPVYNIEQFLARCLDSILAQSFQDFEILVVNDGSTDQSREVCLQYLDKDQRIRFFEQPNRGVSAARNAGIDNAQGEYILFVDGDDFLEVDALERLFRIMTDHALDCVSYMFRKINPEMQILGDTTYGKGNVFYTLNTAEDIALFLTTGGGGPFFSACAHLFRRDIIIENRIRFTEGIFRGEDTLFCHMYALFIKRGCILSDYAGYNYFKHPDSCTATKKDPWLDIVGQTLLHCEAFHHFITERSLTKIGAKELARMSWELIIHISMAEKNFPAPEKCRKILQSHTIKRIVYPAIIFHGYWQRKLMLCIFMLSRNLFRQFLRIHKGKSVSKNR